MSADKKIIKIAQEACIEEQYFTIERLKTYEEIDHEFAGKMDKLNPLEQFIIDYGMLPEKASQKWRKDLVKLLNWAKKQ